MYNSFIILRVVASKKEIYTLPYIGVYLGWASKQF